MRRRSYLALAASTAAGVAGCLGDGLPGTAPAGDPAPPASCPDLLQADRTRCPGDDDGPLSVDRSVAAASADAWAVTVSVTNRDTRAYGYNPAAWSVFRRGETGWHRLAPAARSEPRAELDPGDRCSWALSAASEGPVGAARRVFLALDPGRYAFAVPFRGPDRIAAVAPFAIAA